MLGGEPSESTSTHLGNENSGEDTRPVTDETQEVGKRSGEMRRAYDGDGEVDGGRDDGENEARQDGEEGKDNLNGE